MREVSHVRELLGKSLGDIEPVPFRERLYDVLEGAPLTPGVLTVKTARAIEPSADVEESARRGAGVQLSYEGLRLTRSVVEEKRWEAEGDRSSYYFDLLAAEVLVSRGYHHLATTGVSNQVVDIVRRFGRNQTYTLESEHGELEDSLEVDILRLAVDAGADMTLQTIPAPIRSYGDSLAREIEADPLPDPSVALTGVEERIGTLAASPEPTEVDEYDD